MSAQELVDKIGDARWVGHTVLANAGPGEIQFATCPQPVDSGGCKNDKLMVGSNSYPLTIGVRDSTPDGGVQVDYGAGYRWVESLLPPTEGEMAFRIGRNSIEYLGPAITSAGNGAFEAASLFGNPSDPSDDVYVVEGWLGTTPPAPCAFPVEGQASPMPDINSYYCGGSWLASENWDPDPTKGLTVDGGLHVQGDAYSEFAPNPVGGMGEPGNARHGIYLVRNAGCPEVVTGDCPVWRMVGRLDHTPYAPTGPTPSPPPPATPGSSSVSPTRPGITLDQAIALASEHVASTARVFGYAAGTFRDVNGMFPGGDHILQPPDGAIWDMPVWSIVFEGDIVIGGPSGAPEETPRPAITAVYLDYLTGAYLMASTFSPNGPLPTPFFVLPDPPVL